MRNDKGDIIYPRDFMPQAEASKHSIHIDRWIIAEAIRLIAETNKEGHHYHFVVKLSSASLTDEKFIVWVKHNLERLKVNPLSSSFRLTKRQTTCVKCKN